MRISPQLHLNRNHIPVLNMSDASQLITEVAETRSFNSDYSDPASSQSARLLSAYSAAKRNAVYSADGRHDVKSAQGKGNVICTYA